MPRPYTLAELVARFGGRLIGDPAARIEQVGTLESAQQHQLSFLAIPATRESLAQTRRARWCWRRDGKNES